MATDDTPHPPTQPTHHVSQPTDKPAPALRPWPMADAVAAGREHGVLSLTQDGWAAPTRSVVSAVRPTPSAVEAICQVARILVSLEQALTLRTNRIRDAVGADLDGRPGSTSAIPPHEISVLFIGGVFLASCQAAQLVPPEQLTEALVEVDHAFTGWTGTDSKVDQHGQVDQRFGGTGGPGAVEVLAGDAGLAHAGLEVEPDPRAAAAEAARCLGRAEELLRTFPIDHGPAGTTNLVTMVLDLLVEARTAATAVA